MPKPTTLATGQITKADQLEVELHRPADLPAFVLIKWPGAPSVAAADDDSFDRLVAAEYLAASRPRALPTSELPAVMGASSSAVGGQCRARQRRQTTSASPAVTTTI